MHRFEGTLAVASLTLTLTHLLHRVLSLSQPYQQAWTKPLTVIAAVRRVGGDSHLESVEWMMRWKVNEQNAREILRGQNCG